MVPSIFSLTIGILRVGLTNIVSAQSQLISFEVGQKLGFYQILTKFTYNLYVAEIFIMTPPKLLNATIETMELKHTNQHGIILKIFDLVEDIRYFQYWNYGTQCGMNARTVTLEYKCSATRAFFEVIAIYSIN